MARSLQVGRGRRSAAFDQGSQLLLEGKGVEAEAAFDRAIALDPSFGQAYWMRARLRVPHGGSPHALDAAHPAQRDFQRARELAATLPPLERAWLEASVLASARGPQDDEAERAAFDRLDRMVGHILAVQERRADLAHRRGDLDTALDADHKLARLEPRSAARWNAVARDHLSLGGHDQATTAIARALALAPDDLAVLDTRAEILLTRDPASAEQAFRDILARAPSSPAATTAIAAIQAQRGDWTAARRTLEPARAAASNDLERYVIGDALSWLLVAEGDLPRALTVAEEAGTHATALGADPDNGKLARAFTAWIARSWPVALREAQHALASPKVWQIHRPLIRALEILALIELGRDAEVHERKRALDSDHHATRIQHRIGHDLIAYRLALRDGDTAAMAAALAMLRKRELMAAWASAERARWLERTHDRARLAETCGELRRPTRRWEVLAIRRLSPCA